MHISHICQRRVEEFDRENYYQFKNKTWVDGWNTYNFLTERAEELRFSAFERGRQGTQIYVKMKKFPILFKLTSSKQSLKNR